MEDKRYLICGFGNIAQRHFRNLKFLQPECKIDVCTQKKKSYRIFNNNLDIRNTDNLFKEYDIEKLYHNYSIGLDSNKYDAVIICSLPPERINIAIDVAEKGYNLFIEKPLSINMDRIPQLVGMVNENNVKCAIGYQMRFHPVLQKVKKLIKDKFFGTIYRVEVTHGNSLNNWTKGRDLKKDFYALDPEKGGGVVFSQIHEVDYIQWLFDTKMYTYLVLNNKIKYKIDDNLSILGFLYYNSGKFQVEETIINLNLDFLSPTPVRKLRILGTKKSIDVDIINGSIWYIEGEYSKSYEISWNNLFLNEMSAFLDSLEKRPNEYLANINDGILSLETALNINKLSLTGG